MERRAAMSFFKRISSWAVPLWRNAMRHGQKLLTRLLQQGIRDGEFDLRRTSGRTTDIAHIIVSFAQNSLIDRHHTPLSYRKSLRKTLNFILDSIRA
jgi:hypothetical protein